MLQRIHPFTSLALVLVAIAPVFAFVGEPLVLVILLVLAHGFALLEFKKYTSTFQFDMIVLTAVALGVLVDLRHQSWPLLTVSMALAGTATIMRQAFMQRFTYVNLLWVDTGVSVVSLGLYVAAIWGRPFALDLHLALLLPIGMAVGLTFSYVQDGLRMRRSTLAGYRIKIGMRAIDFCLPDQDGHPVRLSDYQGRHPVLLIFVRGDWCPGCHMMLRTYERNRKRFAEKGIHVVAVGPDDIEVNRDMVARIGVGYRMLSDARQEVSGQYGVVYNNPIIEMGVDYAQGIPLPASFLIDTDGIVRYVSRPDRVGEFLDPDLIFPELDKLTDSAPVAWI
ncbi:MAG: peroxiredoxin family protein [Flavobacteriales bacterium]|nr:peroxiredoxin family protein [Flavobacteriales bacterium]